MAIETYGEMLDEINRRIRSEGVQSAYSYAVGRLDAEVKSKLDSGGNDMLMRGAQVFSGLAPLSQLLATISNLMGQERMAEYTKSNSN